MIITSLMLALAAQGSPQGRPSGPGGGFAQADANGDGVVTREEALAQAEARFAQLDANGDGQISAEELQALRDSFGQGGRGGRRR